ncbi:SCO family protein [Seonamhaeicola marinus]|uniref:SCO family protein n=1 Tax=Seonamhaeicola marinus TaxID=1912246 RepID=A0A5D0HT36_9FLAO|nr:SCO family protein [Seonamhaeicola marinus]TYA74486.1 SCO family protein [Seonamhaeicola marinus]
MNTFKLFLCLAVVTFGCKRVEKKIPIVSSNLNKPESVKKLEAFEIYNHLGEKVALNSYKGQLQVVNFFFSTCPSICPAMENEIEGIATTNRSEDVVFLSVTINPEQDTIPVLWDHASQFLNKPENWFFLRTEPEDLLTVAKMYLATIDTSQNQFYHTSNAVLIDTDLNIRGLYDLLNSQEVDFLKEDIAILLKEKD